MENTKKYYEFYSFPPDLSMNLHFSLL